MWCLGLFGLVPPQRMGWGMGGGGGGGGGGCNEHMGGGGGLQ